MLGEKQPTDLILFGDSRPFHRQAIPLAEQGKIRVHVFEEGYIRPDWITVERGGVNGHSGVPRDPAWYLAARREMTESPTAEHVPTPLWLRGVEDITYHLANATAPILYPHHRTHRPRSPAVEYAGWAWRFSKFPVRRACERRRLQYLLGGDHPLFFLPLQLAGDSQLVRHSPFASIGEVIETVMTSFAANAPSDAELLIKNHPLDTGFDRHEKTVRRLGRELGIRQRVHFFESGNLPLLFKRVQGTVVVNSTVGLVALTYGCPVIALADAIYRLPGLTYQGLLNEFWHRPSPPDMALVRSFRDVVHATTQVNGNFFTRDGIRLAVQGCDRMLAEESPLENLKRRVAGL